MKKVSMKKILSVLLSVTLVAGLLTAIGWHRAEAAATPTSGFPYIAAIGNGNGNWLNGVNWNPGNNTANQMTEVETDVWEITYEQVAASSSYEFKFIAGDSWSATNFGAGQTVPNNTAKSLSVSGDNCLLTVSTLSNVTLRLDLRGFDGSNGAKVLVLTVPTTESNNANGEQVTHNVKNMSYSGTTYRQEGSAYTTQLVPFDACELPETVDVKLEGVTLTVGEDYTYDSITGNVVIKENVGAGKIIISAAATSEYSKIVIAGSQSLLGVEWKKEWENNDSNLMEKDGYKYVKTYENVAAGDYEFKVVKYASPYVTEPKWIGKDGGDNNVTFSTYAEGDVTITFDPNTNQITVDGECIGEYTFKNMSIAGVDTLFEADWSPVTMTETSTGIWGYVIDDVAAGTYTYKYTADNAWTHSWGVDGWYNGANYTITVPYDGSTVTFTVDLTGVDMSDPSKVKLSSSVTVTAPSFDVTLPTGNITASGANTATTGTNYTATLSPENGYGLPETITVTIGGTAYTGYTYNKTTGVVTIPGAAITGNIVISATAVELPDTYNVTLPTGNITATGETTATEGVDYTATLKAADGYVLPDTITVKVNGIVITDYEYNKTTGVITIPAITVSGAIVISATAVKIPDVYNVTLPTGNITATGNTTATEDVAYTVTLKAADGYVLPNAITVKVNGTEITNYSYDKTTGVVTIPADEVTGNIVISATAVQEASETYTLTLPTDTNIEAAVNATPTEGVEFTLTLSAKDGYVLPDSITVTVGGVTCTNFTYNKSTGVVTIPGASVNGNIVISATAVKDDPDTYTVTLPTDTNIVSTGNTTATEGVQYTVTLSAKEGFELPADITVTVGGVAVEYSYNSDTGVVEIPAEVVKGNIVIIATAVEAVEPGPDGSIEYPYTFTDKDAAQPYTVLPGGTLYFNLDFDQFDEIHGKVLQIRHEGAGFGGTPIQIQYGNPRLGMTTISDGGEGDLDGEANGVIVHTIDLGKMQGFALYNQNPRANAYVDVDITTFTPPAPGETASSAVELETTTKIETSVNEATYVEGNIFYYKYTADKSGFFYFWINDVKKNGQSVDDIEADIYMESSAWSASLVSDGKYNKNKDRVEAYVYLEEGEEVIIEVSTNSEFDMTTGQYPNRPAADIEWAAEFVQGTADDPIIVPDYTFQFKFPAGVNVVFAGDFAQKLLTLTNGLGGYEFDNDGDGEPEFITTEKLYVEYEGKKTEVDEEGQALVEIGGDRNSDVLVKVTFGEVEGRLGSFNVTFTSLPAEDNTVITEEDIEKLGATVENNADGTELVIAPIVWETFDRVETLVSDAFKDKAYQMMDIKLVDANGDAVQPEEGKKVSITISLPEAIKAATKVAVSRYDEATGKLVAVATVDVVNGKITFATDHFSTYVFADATPASEDAPVVTPPVVTPDKTADMAPIAMVVLVALLAAAVVVLKKREVNE